MLSKHNGSHKSLDRHTCKNLVRVRRTQVESKDARDAGTVQSLSKSNSTDVNISDKDNATTTKHCKKQPLEEIANK